jgi:RNA polymerase sigma-70 factor (ECF subfamily)
MRRRTFETLVRTHQAQVYRYLRYLGANPAVAEDIAQETFLTVLEKGGPPRSADVGGQGAWLRGIARNLFLRYCRRSRVDPVQITGDTLDQFEGTWSAEFLRDGDGFDYVEALRKCLDSLSQKQRRTLDLRYALKKSRAQMAELCGMTEDGVKTLLRRIRAELVKCVRRRLRLDGTEAA